MGRIRRTMLRLLLGTAVLLALVPGSNVALASVNVDVTAEADTEGNGELWTPGAVRGKSLRRDAGDAVPLSRRPHETLRPQDDHLRKSGQAKAALRFLPSSPDVLILLCQFRC